MKRHRHIIQKQSVDVEMNAGGNAFVFKDKLSDFCTTKLMEAMEALFDKVPADKILFADKIIVDVGELPEDNWENVFIERFVEKMTKCIADVSVFSRSNAYSDYFNHRVNTTDNEPGNTLGEISESESIARSVFYFLKTGLLPWYSSIDSLTALNERFIQMMDDRQFYNNLMKLMIEEDQIVNRIVHQLNPKAIQLILSKAGFDVNLIRSLDEFVRELISSLSVSSSDKANISMTSEYIVYDVLLSGLMACEKKGKTDWNTFTDEVLQLVIHKMTASGLDKIELALRNLKSVELREKGLECFKQISEISKTDHSPADHTTKESVKRNVNKVNAILESEAVFISNSGLVLLHPFLTMLFENVGYLDDKKWVSQVLQQRAIVLTQYMVSGKESYPEFDLVLNKILLGYPVEETLPAEIHLSDFEKQEATDVLKSVVKHWTALKNTSIEGLQASFLTREGKLALSESGWNLQVEQKTMDILLNRIPWSFSIIKTPWMDKKLNVEWSN